MGSGHLAPCVSCEGDAVCSDRPHRLQRSLHSAGSWGCPGCRDHEHCSGALEFFIKHTCRMCSKLVRVSGEG